MARPTNNSPNKVLMDGKTMDEKPENPKMVKKFLKKKSRIEKDENVSNKAHCSSLNTQNAGNSLGQTFLGSIGPPTVDDTIYAKCGQCAVTNDDYNALFHIGKLTRNMVDFTLTRLSTTHNTQTLILKHNIWHNILDGNAPDFVEDELCLKNDFSSYKYILGAHTKNNYSRLICVNLHKKILIVVNSRQCSESVDINRLLIYFEKRNRSCDEQIPTNGWKAENYLVKGNHCEYPSEFSTIMFAGEIMGIKCDFAQNLVAEWQKIFQDQLSLQQVPLEENEVQNIIEKTKNESKMNQNQNDNIPVTEDMHEHSEGPSFSTRATPETNREDPASEMEKDSEEDNIYDSDVSIHHQLKHLNHFLAISDQGEPTNQYNPQSSQIMKREDPASEFEKDLKEDNIYGLDNLPLFHQLGELANLYDPQSSQMSSIFQTEVNSTRNAETAQAWKQEDDNPMTASTESLNNSLSLY